MCNQQQLQHLMHFHNINVGSVVSSLNLLAFCCLRSLFAGVSPWPPWGLLVVLLLPRHSLASVCGKRCSWRHALRLLAGEERGKRAKEKRTWAARA